jgi:predicted DsbA family dithiol-disulfide isomerase
MPPEGEDITEHLARKYGIDAAQIARNREAIRQRGAEVGFRFGPRERTFNTFDAHRLLHWAGSEGGGRQQALKRRLFEVYFTEQRNPADHQVLIDAAASVGLDRAAAAEVLESGRYADEVRRAEHFWQSQGVHSVPAIVINDRYLISGGQPPDAFEKALRSIAGELAAA